MNKPTVAIIGRPNVGKSTLFNRLTRTRRAIVEPTAGVTRDRIYGLADWTGREFHVIDTGGYLRKTDDLIEQTVRRQAQIAMDEAEIVLLLVDGKSGPMPDDFTLAQQLRQQKVAVFVLVNKIDDISHENRLLDFYELGLGEPLALSALSGRGCGDILDLIFEGYPVVEPQSGQDEVISLAIVGVPNAGKSSYLNAILKQEKAIVTPIPGTTRDSVDSYLNYKGKRIRLIDTAGLRRKAKVADAIEFYSAVRTMRSVQECDVAIVLIDAVRGFHAQDGQVINEVFERGKGVVLAVNKWDALEKDGSTLGKWVHNMQDEFKPLEDIPMEFISVHHNQRLWKVIDTALEVYEAAGIKLSTSELNRFLEEAVRYLPPPAVKGKRIQMNYITQVHSRPPVFAIFSNFPDLVPESYRRYLLNRLREKYPFTGLPVKVTFRRK